METKVLSKRNIKDIIQYCEDLEKNVKEMIPCFSRKQLDIIKEILNG